MPLSTDLSNRLAYALAGAAARDELVAAVQLSTVLASGQIVVGSAGGAGVAVALTGDVALSNAGVVTVNASKLAAAESAWLKTDSGVKTLLASAPNDRIVQLAVTVTTTFANGDGAQPTLQLGQTAAATKFADTTAFASKAAAAAAILFAGKLTGGAALIATLVAGTGTTETGAYTIDVQVIG